MRGEKFDPNEGERRMREACTRKGERKLFHNHDMRINRTTAQESLSSETARIPFKIRLKASDFIISHKHTPLRTGSKAHSPGKDPLVLSRGGVIYRNNSRHRGKKVATLVSGTF